LTEDLGGAAGLALFEPQTTEVVGHHREAGVESGCLEVRGGGLTLFTREVIGEAQVIPGLGVGWEVLDRETQGSDGIGRSPGVDEACTFEEGLRAARGAPEQTHGEPSAESDPPDGSGWVLHRQHAGCR
jgi:hypothetical protein